MTQPNDEKLDTGTILEIYKKLIEIRNLDGQIFWVRQNFYFAVSSLFLTATGYAVLSAQNIEHKLPFVLGACAIGLLIACIWIQSARAGHFLIWLWNKKLEKLEQHLPVGIYKTLSEDVRAMEAERDWFKGKYREVNRLAILLALLFLSTWVALTGYLMVEVIKSLLFC